ncbi:MAG: efflux RND transporter permease subunit, partial [Myxococcota bacterium]
MSYMPLTLIVTLSSSLVVAIVINPVVTGYFAQVEGQQPREQASSNRAIKIIGFLLMAAIVLMIALTNPITAGVLVGTGIVAYLAHILVMRHIAERFVQALLPKVVDFYRGFLENVLRRDYSVRWAIARNALGIGCLSAAAALGALALVAMFVFSQTALLVVAVPAIIFGAVGLLLVVVHTVETILLGRMASVKVGLASFLAIGAMLGLISLSTPLEQTTLTALLGAPLVVVAIGAFGLVLSAQTEHLILTDNRAKLMNTVIGGLLVIIALFGVASTGVEFFPNTDPNQIRVVVTGPLGTNLEASNRLATITHGRVDDLLDKDAKTQQNLKNLLVNVGVGGDAQFGGGGRRPERSTITMNLVEFNDRNERSRITLQKIRSRLEGLPSADIEFTQDEQGPPTGPPVNIEITGPDYEQIVKIAVEVRGLLSKWGESGEIQGLVDVRDNLNTGRPELDVRIDRQRAAQFGLSTQKIAFLVRTAVNGSKASTFRDGDDEFDITVRLKEDDRQDLESVKNLTILHEGRQIPLVAVADLNISSGLGSITRKDLQRVVTVSANVATEFNAQAVLAEVQKKLQSAEGQLPTGYSMKFTGESEDQQKSFAFLFTALL